jgi:hypothetical protein
LRSRRVSPSRACGGGGGGPADELEAAADPPGPLASAYCDPLGPPAPPSVGQPFSATAIELSTEPLRLNLNAGCIDLPLPARSSFLRVGVLLSESTS